jgi:hypothetical protein
MNGVVLKMVRVGSSRGEPEVDGLGRAFHVTISHADGLSTTNQSIHEQHRIVNSHPVSPFSSCLGDHLSIELLGSVVDLFEAFAAAHG